MDEPLLHLASSSPRRREILTALGLRFSAEGVGIDEARIGNEPVRQMALRLAREKALASGSPASLPVLGADTVVVAGDSVFGKPVSEASALDMLAALSGRVHQVITAVALSHKDDIHTAVSETAVWFRDIHPDEARAYWQSGEPLGKAGGYAIQGLGGAFVARLSGSYSGVVGLPVFETVALLKLAGIDILAAAN
jgi:septum formation protein